MDRNTSTFTVRVQDIVPEKQRQGLGSKALKEVVDHALDQKLTVKSDASLTENAAKTWEKLADEYIIERNPDAILEKGVLKSEAVGIPVFKVYEKKLRGVEIDLPVIDYGKVYEQARSEDIYRTITKDTDIPAGDLPRNPSTLFVDERPFWALERDLYNTTEHVETKFGTATTEILVKEHKAKFPDLPPRYGEGGQFIVGRGQYVSPRSVGIFKRNPIVKWATSQVERKRMWVQQQFHELMSGTDVIIKFGKPTWKPTERCWRTQLEQLPQEQQVKVIQLRDMYDEPGRVGKPERTVLEAQGLSPKAIDVFYKDWDLVHGVSASRNKTATEIGKTGKNVPIFELHDGYSPRIWDGDFRVFVKNKAGEVIQTGAAKTLVGAKQLQKSLQDKFGDKYTTNYYARKGGTNDLSIDAINDIIVRAQEKFPEQAAELREFLESQKEIKGVNVHGLQRKGSRGFLGDPKTQLDTNKLVQEFIQSREIFVHGMLRNESSLRLNFQMDLLKGNPVLKRLYPNSIKYSGTAVDYFLGKKP